MRNCSNNTLKICKFMETREGINKPSGGEEFHIKVESCSMKRYYVLNQNNCYCVELEHLCNETYCVYELGDEYEVRYEVDNVSVDEACVNFNGTNMHHIKIINQENSHCGNLVIKKRIFNECGKEISSDGSFTINVRGVDYDESFALNRNNGFEVVLECIPFGRYEVSEDDITDYDVTYYVNGVEQENGIIDIDAENNEVVIHNRMNNGTHYLRVCKWIKIDGKLVKPNYDQSFDFVLKDSYAFKEYTLDCSNHFCTVIEGNKYDTFTLEELDANNVIYEVDGVEVESVEVTLNSDHDVRIINLDSPCPCGSELHLQKWMEENGNLFEPSLDDVFYIHIQGYSSEAFELNAANNFKLSITDIEPGYYYIYEDMASEYNVVFDVNGVIQEDGYIFVDEGKTYVSVINQIDTPIPGDNTITLLKRVNSTCDGGQVTMPESGSFEVYVNGPNGGENYTLSMDNNYELIIPAVNGDYVIYEVNPEYTVTYRLDGVDHYNEVEFTLVDSSHEVMVINHVNHVNYVI